MRSMCSCCVQHLLPIAFLPGWCLGEEEGLGTCSSEVYAAHIADVDSAQHHLQASGDYRYSECFMVGQDELSQGI